MFGSGVSDEDIEEVVSDTFVVIWQFADSYHPRLGVPAAAWIRRIHLHRALDRRRSWQRHRERHESLTEEWASRLTVPDDTHEALESAIDLRPVLARFRTKYPADADLIDRRYYQAQEPSDIAKALGLQPTTVRVRLHRALAKLRTMLGAGTDGRKEGETL